jgi:hypothetical protein
VSTSRQQVESEWLAGWRNSGYEMGDWFKSYWDRWISYYDAGAQEQTLASAQAAVGDLAKAGFSNPLRTLAMILAPLVGLLLAALGWRALRPPTPQQMYDRLSAWLDQASPEVSRGEHWPSRLSRLPSPLGQQAMPVVCVLESCLFDPSHPPLTRLQRRMLQRQLTALLRAWATMVKSSRKSAPLS